jgi:transglutaminase-like putative cysteine protease
MVDHPLLPRYSWAEVWVDGWLAVDPNEGQVPASTSLLRVMEGPGRVIPLVTVAGALQVTPIAISKERQN